MGKIGICVHMVIEWCQIQGSEKFRPVPAWKCYNNFYAETNDFQPDVVCDAYPKKCFAMHGGSVCDTVAQFKSLQY